MCSIRRIPRSREQVLRKGQLMTSKELRKLSRKELVELFLIKSREYEAENEKLRAELETTRKELTHELELSRRELELADRTAEQLKAELDLKKRYRTSSPQTAAPAQTRTGEARTMQTQAVQTRETAARPVQIQTGTAGADDAGKHE